jgi:hypothetical protein
MTNQNPWTVVEIEGFLRRQKRLIKNGLSEPDAERLAEQLVHRDRDAADKRRLCLECTNWVGECTVPKKGYCTVPTLLKRCDGFLAVVKK